MIVVDGVEMVDVQEAARLVDRTPETIRRWVWSERLTASKHGTRLLIERSALLSAAGKTDARSTPYSLAEWAQEVASTWPNGRRGATASDIVRADRARRADAGR